MIKMRLFFIILFSCLLSGAKAFELPSPIKSINLKSSNSATPKQVKVGEQVNIKIDYDQNYSFDSIEFLEETLRPDPVCDETLCSINLTITLTKAMLSTDAKLIFKYKKNNQLRRIVFETTPIELLAANAQSKDISFIKLKSNNSSFQNLAFVGDKLLLSFLSNEDFELNSIESLKISGIELNIDAITHLTNGNIENKKIHMIEIPITEVRLGKFLLS